MQKDLAHSYVEDLRSGLGVSEAMLASWSKWPWSRRKVPKLLRNMANTHVILGIEEFHLGNFDDSKAAFGRAIDLCSQRESLRPTKSPSHFDIQILSAGFCVGFPVESEVLAERLFYSFEPDQLGAGVASPDAKAVSRGRHGTAALLGWMSKRTPSEVEAHARVSLGAGPPMGQFRLWGVCALAAVSSDGPSLQNGVDQLAAFAERSRRSGDFAYTEDRLIYLPGMGIIALANRDKLVVVIPNSEQYPKGFLDRYQS